MSRHSGRPNIVLITIESLRADFVGYLNSKERNTPFLDTLAQDSLVYQKAIAPGVPTFFHFPFLMTGQMPFTYGYKLGIPDAVGNKTIAEVLRDNGYKTIAVLGNNPQLYSLYNFDRGFDMYLDGSEGISKSNLFFINSLWNVKQRLPFQAANVLDYLRAAVTILSGATPSHISGKNLNQKIRNIISSQAVEPFFLWVHYMDAHFPYLSGIDRIKGLVKKIFFYKKLVGSITALKIDNPQLIELVKEVYRGGVIKVDEAISELYEGLISLYPQTIFIITSDHGEAFMDHGMFGHEACSLYDELIKVPLLIHLPSKKKKIVKDVVSTISLAKTICSLLNIHIPSFEGIDLTKLNHDVSVNHVSKILFNCISPTLRLQIFDNETEIRGFNELVSYTTSDYKYIVEIGKRREELYHLTTDPKEQKNLIHTIPHSTLSTFRKKVKRIL